MPHGSWAGYTHPDHQISPDACELWYREKVQGAEPGLRAQGTARLPYCPVTLEVFGDFVPCFLQPYKGDNSYFTGLLRKLNKTTMSKTWQWKAFVSINNNSKSYRSF